MFLYYYNLGEKYLPDEPGSFYCIQKSTNQRYPVNIHTKAPGDNGASLAYIQQKTATLLSVNHPNIICLKEVFLDKEKPCFVLEMAEPGNDLFDTIKTEHLGEGRARGVFAQPFSAVKYLVSAAVEDPGSIPLTTRSTSGALSTAT